MEIERGIDDLIKVTQILRKKNKNIYILLAGKKRNDLNIDYDFIYYLGNIPFSDVPIAMACCDVLTLPYRNSIFLDNASSCKISEYISMNIPIIATKSENTLNTLSKNSHQNVIFCPLNDLNEMSSSIEKQLLMPKSNYSHKPDILTWYEISKISFKN
jgi:glycosyltransferase involved in cell wall biosynthesis